MTDLMMETRGARQFSGGFLQTGASYPLSVRPEEGVVISLNSFNFRNSEVRALQFARVPAKANSVENSHYPKLFVGLSYLVFCLLAVGVIAAFWSPSRSLVICVPIGFTLWAFLAPAISRWERQNKHA